MRRPASLTGCVAFLGALVLPVTLVTPVAAQLIQIGPGFVRAPFVRVVETPGGTWVRAPFVNQITPRVQYGFARPYAYPAPVYPYRGVPVYSGQPGQVYPGQPVTASAATPAAAATRASGVLPQPTPAAGGAVQATHLEPVPAETALVTPSTIAPRNARPISPPATARPTQPTPADPSELDWSTLRRMVRLSARDLEESLAGVKTGDQWLTHLETGLIAEIVDDEANTPPDASTRKSLAEVLAIFDATAAEPRYSGIAKREPFQRLHAALGEMLSDRSSGLKRQLGESARRLDAALAAMPGGVHWQRHLQMPAGVFVEEAAPGSAAPLPPGAVAAAEPDAAALKTLLVRFDQVASDPQFVPIARRAEFVETHNRLTAYVERIGTAPTESPKPATQEPATGEPATGERATGERATGESATGESATGEPATGERATGERAEQDSRPSEPAKLNPKAAEPTGQQSTGLNSVIKSPATREPAVKRAAGGTPTPSDSPQE